MDEHKQRDDVEDLVVDEEAAEDVKGGGITANDDWESPVAIWVPQGSPVKPKSPDTRGGWDGNHNETLVVL